MEEPRHRLQRARIAAGYETPSDAARALKGKGVNKNTLISHENGHRPVSRKAAEMYGRLFDVRAGWLLFGEQDEGSQEARLERLRQVLEKAEQIGSVELTERIIDQVEFEVERHYKVSRSRETLA